MISWITALALCLVSFALLASVQARHAQRVFGCWPDNDTVRACRQTGWLLLAATVLWCVYQFDIAIGLIALSATMTLAGLTIALMLTWRPRWLSRGVFVVFSVAVTGVLVDTLSTA